MPCRKEKEEDMVFAFCRILVEGGLPASWQRRAVIAALTVFLAVGAIPMVAHAGMIALYNFSGNALDSSGNELHGTVNGATLTTDRLGNQNSAYLFDNINDSIIVPNTGGLLSLSGPFSMAVWVRPDNPSFDGRNNPIIWKLAGPGDPDNYTLAWHSGNRFGAGLEDSVTDLDLGVYSASHTPGSWYHVAAVYDRQTYKIFVDGVLEGSATINNITPYMGAAPLRIGNIIGSTHANAGVFDGAIDEIGIFDHALSQEEIATLSGGTQVVPEPSSMAIFAIGLGVGGVMRRYRQRKNGRSS